MPMFDSLSGKLQGVFATLGRRGSITEKDLEGALREVRLALLEADVNYKVARDYIKAVRGRANTDEVMKSPTPLNRVVEIINEELITLLGTESPSLQRASQGPTLILMVGLQGSGKTTTSAKLALRARKAGERPLLIAADVYRPAAIDQLQALGKQLDIEVFELGADERPVKIVEHGLDRAAQIGAGTVIVDTAGRLHIDEQMMSEITELRDRFSPTEVLLVADAMSGQDAVNAASAFDEAVGITGVVLSKMDGDARGGAALSIRAVTGAPIKFLGIGERPDALEQFHPDRLAGRILGRGDMSTLVERAEQEFGEQDAQAWRRRLQDGDFDLDDFIEQIGKVRQMGPISQIVGMIPGLSSIKNQIEVDEIDDDFFSHFEAIVLSMTPEERRKPDMINGSRRRRIAAGSGTTPQEVNQLLNQFKQAKGIMKDLASGRMPSMPGVSAGRR
ncbi:MAG: signal recognition particle protein [Chloroflexi bacterium]|nr:signal recognition particle protein [Chloroflexota bacterium]MCY3695696.1 signal recognition particle protein [Chloroflexota bacterium]